MIYTVTLNPSIDYIVRLDSLVPGITNRTTAEEYYYGGKGINVSCVLAELDLESTAFGFVALRVTPLKRVFATTELSPTLLSLKVEFQEST
jgi:fructose-1-phosphate kinase PfkB-like protein